MVVSEDSVTKALGVPGVPGDSESPSPAGEARGGGGASPPFLGLGHQDGNVEAFAYSQRLSPLDTTPRFSQVAREPPDTLAPSAVPRESSSSSLRPWRLDTFYHGACATFSRLDLETGDGQVLL